MSDYSDKEAGVYDQVVGRVLPRLPPKIKTPVAKGLNWFLDPSTQKRMHGVAGDLGDDATWFNELGGQTLAQLPEIFATQGAAGLSDPRVYTIPTYAASKLLMDAGITGAKKVAPHAREAVGRGRQMIDDAFKKFRGGPPDVPTQVEKKLAYYHAAGLFKKANRRTNQAVVAAAQAALAQTEAILQQGARDRAALIAASAAKAQARKEPGSLMWALSNGIVPVGALAAGAAGTMALQTPLMQEAIDSRPSNYLASALAGGAMGGTLASGAAGTLAGVGMKTLGARMRPGAFQRAMAHPMGVGLASTAAGLAATQPGYVLGEQLGTDYARRNNPTFMDSLRQKFGAKELDSATLSSIAQMHAAFPNRKTAFVPLSLIG